MGRITRGAPAYGPPASTPGSLTHLALTRLAPTLFAVAVLAAGCTGADSAPPAAEPATMTDAAPADTTAAVGTTAPVGYPDRFGFGREATHEEITAWDIDVMPDGTGLPEGEGSHADGAPIYLRHCASCHGRAGEGMSAEPLVGYEPGTAPPFGPRYEEWRGDGDDVPFTVGNYWPYATTLFDYIRRAMPSNAPGTLANDEVYALSAWLLAENGIIETDAVMNASTLAQVQMPARDVFVPQER